MNRAAKSVEFMQLGHPRRRRKATNVSLKKTGSRNGLSFLPLARMFTAEEERIFSMVRKNKTAFRPNLDPKGTLSSILTIKLGSHQPAHVFEPPKSMLKKAKTATWDYNKLHAKKWCFASQNFYCWENKTCWSNPYFNYVDENQSRSMNFYYNMFLFK